MKKQFRILASGISIMHPDTPNRDFDDRMGRLASFLDMKIIKKWALSNLPLARRENVTILDVGAGKGRMTRQLLKIAKHCVAIEPFPPFYSILKSSCNARNLKTYQSTLFEYSKIAEKRFDIVYVCGVTPYLDDKELFDFMVTARNLLSQDAFLLIREHGTGVSRRQCGLEIYRTPDEIKDVAQHAGYVFIKYSRAYPVNIPWILYKSRPNSLTKFIWNISSGKVFYPLWEFLATVNLFQNKDTFFVYMFRAAK